MKPKVTHCPACGYTRGLRVEEKVVDHRWLGLGTFQMLQDVCDECGWEGPLWKRPLDNRTSMG